MLVDFWSEGCVPCKQLDPRARAACDGDSARCPHRHRESQRNPAIGRALGCQGRRRCYSSRRGRGRHAGPASTAGRFSRNWLKPTPRRGSGAPEDSRHGEYHDARHRASSRRRSSPYIEQMPGTPGARPRLPRDHGAQYRSCRGDVRGVGHFVQRRTIPHKIKEVIRVQLSRMAACSY